MSIQAAKEELVSLTPFQRDIHITDSIEESIISNFYRAFIKSTWYSSIPMKLKRTEDGEEIVYTVNNSFHFLLYTYMRFVLPAIRVKEEYKGRVRIAWCHNIGININVQAKFKEDDDTYHTWDNVWADIFFQFYQSSGAGKRKNHNIGIGNVKCLEEWTEFLPRYPINIDQPWFYSMDTALAFPIFYKNSQTRAEHRYTFRRNIKNLLRVQILTSDHKWKNTSRGLNYLDINSNAKIEIPELWGRYAYITESEIKWYKSCFQSRVFYTRDIVNCDNENPHKFGSISVLSLHSTNPCLAFFWVAENKDATDGNNYSNYTTDSHDLYSGWDPIKNITLTYGTTVRLEKMASDHFSIAEARKHFPSAPNEIGYHGYSFAWDSTTPHGDIGIVFSGMNAKLYCTMANNNIFSTAIVDKDEDDGENNEEQGQDIILNMKDNDNIQEEVRSTGVIDTTSPNFIARARLLIIRKFTITSVKTADAETYNFTII